MRPTWLSIAILLAGATGLHGQQRPAVEMRGGIVVPLGDFREGLVAGTELAPGPSFAVSLQIPRRTRSALLLGFAQHHLRCSGAPCGGAGTLVSTAWNIGGRWTIRPGGSAPWVRLAMLLNRSEADFLEEGSVVRRASYLGLGGEAGVGVSVHFGETLTLSPGARFGVLDTLFPHFGTVSMRYAVIDLGLTFVF